MQYVPFESLKEKVQFPIKSYTIRIALNTEEKSLLQASMVANFWVRNKPQT